MKKDYNSKGSSNNDNVAASKRASMTAIAAPTKKRQQKKIRGKNYYGSGNNDNLEIVLSNFISNYRKKNYNIAAAIMTTGTAAMTATEKRR